jgi:hypothetical protein
MGLSRNLSGQIILGGGANNWDTRTATARISLAQPLVGGEGPRFNTKEWFDTVSQEGMPGAFMAFVKKYQCIQTGQIFLLVNCQKIVGLHL